MVEYSIEPSSWISSLSIAPGVAGMPHLIPLPSKAGPAEQAQVTSQSRFPTTSSPLVPASMNIDTASPSFSMGVWRSPAVMSPPT